jgi:hypothetical protein
MVKQVKGIWDKFLGVFRKSSAKLPNPNPNEDQWQVYLDKFGIGHKAERNRATIYLRDKGDYCEKNGVLYNIDESGSSSEGNYHFDVNFDRDDYEAVNIKFKLECEQESPTSLDAGVRSIPSPLG